MGLVCSDLKFVGETVWSLKCRRVHPITSFPETESENEFRPLDERIDEFHPKATRTLFIGNLEKTTTYHDLLNIFQRFGEIVVQLHETQALFHVTIGNSTLTAFFSVSPHVQRIST